MYLVSTIYFPNLVSCKNIHAIILYLSYVLNYSMEQSPLEKLIGSQLVKKLPAYYGTRRFITAFTSAGHLSLTLARPIQSMIPSPFLKISPYVLTFHLGLGFPCGPFSSVFPHQKPVCTSSCPNTCYMPCPSQFSRFNYPNVIWWGIQSLSFLLRSFLHSLVTSSLLGQNILLSTIFSNTLRLPYSLNVSDQVSHPYKTQQGI